MQPMDFVERLRVSGATFEPTAEDREAVQRFGRAYRVETVDVDEDGYERGTSTAVKQQSERNARRERLQWAVEARRRGDRAEAQFWKEKAQIAGRALALCRGANRRTPT